MPNTNPAYSVTVSGQTEPVYEGNSKDHAKGHYRRMLRTAHGQLVSLFCQGQLWTSREVPAAPAEKPVYVITRTSDEQIGYLSALGGWVSGKIPRAKKPRAEALARLMSFDTPLDAAQHMLEHLLRPTASNGNATPQHFAAHLSQLSITRWEVR